MSPRGILSLAKCIGFMDEKEEPSLELVMLTLVKTRDPFLWIRKKIGHSLSFEAGSKLPWPLLEGKRRP